MLKGIYLVLKSELKESQKGNEYGKITLAEMGEKGEIFTGPELVDVFEPGKKYDFLFFLNNGKLDYVSHKEVK